MKVFFCAQNLSMEQLFLTSVIEKEVKRRFSYAIFNKWQVGINHLACGKAIRTYLDNQMFGTFLKHTVHRPPVIVIPNFFFLAKFLSNGIFSYILGSTHVYLWKTPQTLFSFSWKFVDIFIKLYIFVLYNWGYNRNYVL